MVYKAPRRRHYPFGSPVRRFAFIPFQHFWTFHEAINHSGLDRGSIGYALDVVRHNPDSRVIALVAGKMSPMAGNCTEFSPRYAVMDRRAQNSSKIMLQQHGSHHEDSERSAGCLL